MTRPKTFGLAACVLALIAGLGAVASAQERSANQQIKNNPLLEQHSNFFKKKVYDLHKDPKSSKYFPPDLSYQAYSAVGYDLANTIVLVGPDNGLVIVDTLGDQQTATDVLNREIRPKLRENGYPNAMAERLPIKAIIYTHNHIDHTGGVEGFLKQADRPPCAPETPQTQGQDGSFTARNNCVEVISQKQVVENVTITATVAGNIINPRSAYMYGSFLPGGPVNDGIGPQVNKGNPGPGFWMPSRTFTNELKVSVAGMNLKLIYVPSETSDELAVFLPNAQNRKSGGASSNWDGEGLLLSAEVIQGPSFPNLYSLRGTGYRNPATWFRSVDQLRKLDSWCMVPAHGVPLCGGEYIQTLLRNFRDAIQFTHDQSVRRMNQGHTPPEMAEIIKLPEYLITDLEKLKPAMPESDMNPLDYLLPFYGSVPQAVRELYFGYVGWYQADPTGLVPNAPKDLAARYVAMMGGRDKVLAAANEAISRGDSKQDKAEWQWAAELLTQLVRVNHEDRDARKLKADALRKMAQPTMSNPEEWRDWGITSTDPNWRNWYLTSAMELNLPNGAHFPAISGGLVSPDIQAALPPGAWVNSWTMRLNAEKSASAKPMSVGFEFTPTPGYDSEGNQRFVLNLRRAVCEYWVIDPWSPSDDLAAKDPKKAWDQAGVQIQMTRAALRNLLVAEAEAMKKRAKEDRPGAKQDETDPLLAAILEAIRNGQLKLLKGTPAEVEAFFKNFDPRMDHAPYLTVR